MRHVDRVKFVLRKTNDQSVLLQILCTSFHFRPKKYHGELVSRGFFPFFHFSWLPSSCRGQIWLHTITRFLVFNPSSLTLSQSWRIRPRRVLVGTDAAWPISDPNWDNVSNSHPIQNFTVKLKSNTQFGQDLHLEF